MCFTDLSGFSVLGFQFLFPEPDLVTALTGTDEAAGRRCLSDVAQSVHFNRLSGKWSSADQAADRCLTSG